MLIPAFFIILGGFHQIYTNRNFKKAVKAAIMDRGFKGTHKLEDIALEVGIKPNTLLRVLHDLRTSGFVKYRFNSKTGEIILGEDIENGFIKSEESEKIQKMEPVSGASRNFCPYCGFKLREGANFCENCGSKI